MKQTSYVFPLGDETWTKKKFDTSQVCLGNIYQYPPSNCIWRKPKLSLQRLWMLRMLHWLHRLQLHRWLMNGWCMLQWLWHWLHWLGHWLRHRLPSMNLSRCCLIAKGRWDTHQTWQFGWPCLVRCKNSKWIQDLGGRYQNKQHGHGAEINAIKYSQSIQEWFHCTITASSWRSEIIEAHWSSILLHTNFKCPISTNEIFPKITNY